MIGRQQEIYYSKYYEAYIKYKCKLYVQRYVLYSIIVQQLRVRQYSIAYSLQFPISAAHCIMYSATRTHHVIISVKYVSEHLWQY